MCILTHFGGKHLDVEAKIIGFHLILQLIFLDLLNQFLRRSDWRGGDRLVLGRDYILRPIGNLKFVLINLFLQYSKYILVYLFHRNRALIYL